MQNKNVGIKGFGYLVIYKRIGKIKWFMLVVRRIHIITNTAHFNIHEDVLSYQSSQNILAVGLAISVYLSF